MSCITDFVIENGTLKKYIGTDTRIVIPDSVICIEAPSYVGNFEDWYVFSECSICQSIYIPETVKHIRGEIFRCYALDDGLCYNIEIVGGKHGSEIEYYCNERDIPFVEIQDSEIDEFCATSVEDLKERARRQNENKTECFIDEGIWQAKFKDHTLEFFVPNNVDSNPIVISDMKRRINPHMRKRVKKLIIGHGVTGIADYAFDGFENIESIYIGKDVCKISSTAFDNTDIYSDNFRRDKLSSITVDEQNMWYKSVDDVLYTHDRRTLVKYPSNRPALYFEVNCNIGDFAFAYAKNLQCIKVSGDCVSIGEYAFLRAYSIRHAWFDKGVTNWPEKSPPFATYHRMGLCSFEPIIGGPLNSPAHKHCEKKNSWRERFLPIEEDDVEDFLAHPLPPKKESGFFTDEDGLLFFREGEETDPYVLKYEESRKT